MPPSIAKKRKKALPVKRPEPQASGVLADGPEPEHVIGLQGKCQTPAVRNVLTLLIEEATPRLNWKVQGIQGDVHRARPVHHARDGENMLVPLRGCPEHREDRRRDAE